MLAITGALWATIGLIVSIVSAADQFGRLMIDLGIIIFLIASLATFIVSIAFIVHILTGASRRIAIVLTLLITLAGLLFRSFIIFLIGGDTTAYKFAEPSTIAQAGWLGILQSVAIDGILLCLFAGPLFAHRFLPWNEASDSAKARIPRWLAVCAALSTGLAAVLFYFGNGPLSQIQPGLLVVAILFAVALLVPIYRIVAIACWQWGLLHVIDLHRWRQGWQPVIEDLRRAKARLLAELEARFDSGNAGTGNPALIGDSKAGEKIMVSPDQQRQASEPAERAQPTISSARTNDAGAEKES
jgi:hypothetical protein